MRQYKPWTLEEVRKLRDFRNRGYDNKKIAKLMKRSEATIRWARAKFAPTYKTKTATKTVTETKRSQVLSKFYRTKDNNFLALTGDTVKIVPFEGAPPYTILGVIFSEAGPQVSMWTDDGINIAGPTWNLILKTKNEPFKIPMWVNVYRQGNSFNLGLGHRSKQTADAMSKEAGVDGIKVACIKVMVEGKEGDGM